MGIGVSAGIERMGVDGTVAPMGKEELGGLCVEVVLVEWGNSFDLTVEDQVGEHGGIAGFVVVDEPPNSWMEPWQGLRQ